MAAGQGQPSGWSLGVPGLMHPVLQRSPCCLGTVPDFKPPPRAKQPGRSSSRAVVRRWILGQGRVVCLC